MLKEVQPQGGGDGRLDLAFFHANYTTGVQEKVYTLRVLRRAPGYMLSERLTPDGDERTLILIEAITGDWLHRHFPELGIEARDNTDLGEMLDRATNRVTTR